MFSQTPRDIPIQVTSDFTASERRITPSWTVSHFKGRLESITGIPPSCQRLVLKLAGGDEQVIEASNEDVVRLESWPLHHHAVINVQDTRPASQRTNFLSGEEDTSLASKYSMSDDAYEKLTDSVLAWKRAEKLGRFDPSLPAQQAARVAAKEQEIEARGIVIGARCRLLPADTDDRRGQIAYVGEVPELPGGVQGTKWIGVRLDEPVGKNDGRVQKSGKRYFDCEDKRGVFVQPERIEIGAWEEAKGIDEALAEEMEEI